MSEPVTFDRLRVGQTYSRRNTVTDEQVRLFAAATGDTNPLHLDEEFARGTTFGGRIAHGMLTAGFVSAVLGTEFPGLGTVYLSQTIRFLRPVRIGDRVEVRLEVLELIPGKGRARLATRCFNQDGDEVFTGEAVVIPPR